MATEKVVSKKAVEFPLDQIGYDAISAYVANVEKLATVMEKAVWDEGSFEKLRQEFFDAYEAIKCSLVVWRDRLGNVLPSKDYNHSKPAPNSWLDYAKKNGFERVQLPKNFYDEKLAELEAKEKADGSTKLNYYYGDWGIVDREDWLGEVLEAWGAELEPTVDITSDTFAETEKVAWYKKLWNWIRRAN